MPTIAGYITSENKFESSSTAVFQARHPGTGQTVVLKLLKGDHPANELINRITQEYTLISSFDSNYIVKAYGLEKHNNSLVMVLEDCYSEFEALTSLISDRPVNIVHFLQVAVEITRGLDVVHSHNVIYRDLNPSNILVSKDYSQIKFIDFNTATGYETWDEECRTARLPEGTLAYMSPEQTGRLEHTIDYRTDFYSLGVTLFQLATGRLPFASTSTGEIIHAHLAQTPPYPSQLNSAIPASVSAIILKLLKKTKSSRYQTCRGILKDLGRCLDELTEYGTIRDFEPGEHDIPLTLQLPSTLYHRDTQLQLIKAAFDRAATGNIETFLIKGHQGTGKSSLLYYLKNSLVHEEIYFLHARFESVSTSTPYTALSWSVRQLVCRILSENSIFLNRWMERLQQLVNDDCGVLTSIIPELEQILGPQKPPADLDPTENELRFFKVFGNFLQLCCHTNTPLVLFLDDIDKADPASLKLLEHILYSADLHHLLFIGTLTTTEEPGNPVPEFLRPPSTIHLSAQQLSLQNLDHAAIEKMLSNALARKRTDVVDLAAICFQKTAGHPSHLRQFLHSINREGLLAYSQVSQNWVWDLTALQQTPLTKYAANMLAQNIEALPPATCNLLSTAACLEESFSLKLISNIHGYQLAESTKILKKTLEQGYIYKLVKDKDTRERDCRYHFAHAQIREVFLMLLKDDERADIHLKAGRYLLTTLRADEYHNCLFEIAKYLNGGLRQVVSDSEKLQIAQVNLDAGRKSRLSENYQAAHRFFTAGIFALPATGWQTHYSLTLELYIAACETGFLSGTYGDVEKYFQIVCAKATTIYDTCRVYRVHIKAMKAQSLPQEAVSACLEILAKLGVHIPAHPSLFRTFTTMMLSRMQLLHYSRSRLLDLPQMENKRAHIIMGFLHDTGTSAYSTNASLLPLLSFHAIQLSLKYGNSQESSVMGYLTYGFLLCALSGRRIQEGYEFGQLALKLQKQLSYNTNSCQSTYVYSSFISHWNEHIRNTLPDIQTAIHGCFACGDLDMTTNAAFSFTVRHYLIGTNLNQTGLLIEEQYERIRQLSQHLELTKLKIFRQAVANLQGKGDDPLVLKGKYYDEDKSFPAYLAAKDYSSYCVALLIKMIHAVQFHDCQRAISLSKTVRKYLRYVAASACIPVYHFYESLAHLACYDKLNFTARVRTRILVARNQKKMKCWAQYAPENYSHKYSLVEAERARILGNTEQAMEWYDKAILQAHEHEYLQEEALAYELAARFYTIRSKAHISRSYLREARYCYYRWGATAKVHQLDQQEWYGRGYQHIPVPTLDTMPHACTLIPSEGASRLDMLTVIKASRILSGEMVLDELLKKMMRIMLESGGAQRGFLIFKEKGEWTLKVRGSLHITSIVSLTNIPVASQSIASTAIINYVVHTAKNVVLEDACKDRIFRYDSYVLQKKIRSVLCMPILHQNDIFCILYLENNLATAAFPPDRQELLHLLGTQAAISLKNSSLFEELEGTVGKLHNEVEKRRSTQHQLLHAEKLSAMGRLSASIAHEFGNPLMGVKYLLDDFYKRKDIRESDRHLIELGLEECERMKNLIKDLQRLNKPSSGKKSRIDVHHLLDNVLLFQKKHLSSNRIRLKTHYDHSLPEIEVIVDQITQVLFNLTINAVDAMSKNGGTLTLTTRRHEDGMAIDIQDTGAGIPYENQEQVFEPFFSTKREEDGTGLGLSISYGIVLHHKGNLSFISTPGEGTTFTLSFPCNAVAANEPTMGCGENLTELESF